MLSFQDYSVSEKIHTGPTPWKVIGNSEGEEGGGGGGVLQAKILVVMYELKLNWNFLGRGV